MAAENAKQREIRLQIEDLVQQHVAASDRDNGQPEGLVVLEVAVAVYTRHPDTPQKGGYYIQISDPAMAPHTLQGLMEYCGDLIEDEDDE